MSCWRLRTGFQRASHTLNESLALQEGRELLAAGLEYLADEASEGARVALLHSPAATAEPPPLWVRAALAAARLPSRRPKIAGFLRTLLERYPGARLALLYKQESSDSVVRSICWYDLVMMSMGCFEAGKCGMLPKRGPHGPHVASRVLTLLTARVGVGQMALRARRRRWRRRRRRASTALRWRRCYGMRAGAWRLPMLPLPRHAGGGPRALAVPLEHGGLTNRRLQYCTLASHMLSWVCMQAGGPMPAEDMAGACFDDGRHARSHNPKT